MKRTFENTSRTLAVALCAWALAAAASSASIASRFAAGEIAGLALFAFAFAASTAVLDPGLRRHLEAARASGLATWVLGAGSFVLVTWGPRLADAQGAAMASPLGFLETFTALFAAPVAAAALVVLAARFARRAPVRLPAAKGPGVRPAVS